MDGQNDEQFWATPTNQQQNMYDGFSDKSQVLDFQSFDQSGHPVYWNGDYSASQNTDQQYPDPSTPGGAGDPFGTMQQQSSFNQVPSIFTPGYGGDSNVGTEPGMGIDPTEFDEPPLLDELEIYPRRIMEKSLAVLNPFQGPGALVDSSDYLFKETDLAGPITFCLTLAACLSISDSKAQFGYIYGLSAISVLMMFCLITLMCNVVESHVTLSAVASVLGYSILPIVFLSMIGVFARLDNFYGMVVGGAAILLATMSSSRMFCTMTGDPHQRYLVAYPSLILMVALSQSVKSV